MSSSAESKADSSPEEEKLSDAEIARRAQQQERVAMLQRYQDEALRFAREQADLERRAVDDPDIGAHLCISARIPRSLLTLLVCAALALALQRQESGLDVRETARAKGSGPA